MSSGNDNGGELSRSCRKLKLSAETHAVHPVVDFTAGVVAGGVGLVVGQPIDVVKVRYQTPEFSGRYTSIYGALRSILREEKVPGLFKGVMSPMAGIAFVNGVIFSSYGAFMNMLHKGQSEPTLGQICLAGTGSGMVGALLTCPIELVKIRQQSMPTHLNPSAWSVTRDIVRQAGVRGLYCGFSATLFRELAFGPYFWSYEAMLRYFKARRVRAGEHFDDKPHGHGLIDEAEAEMHTLSWPELMAAGGVAGVVAWAVTFPFDVFKTRMQSSAVWEESRKRGVRPPGLWSVARQSIRADGWQVMFAGLSPTLVRAVPVNMVIFLTFELIVGSFQ